MEPSKLKAFANELSPDEVAVILALGTEPYKLELIAKEVQLPIHRVKEILVKFERHGFIHKRWD